MTENRKSDKQKPVDWSKIGGFGMSKAFMPKRTDEISGSTSKEKGAKTQGVKDND